MATPTKILLIALDAAERDLIVRWGEEDVLPAFQSLRQGGAWGDAPAMPGLGSGALWPSFATGVTPARHGRYFGSQIERGTYEVSKFRGRIEHDPFWKTLSDAGRRVAVIDVPYDQRCENLNGIQIVDWAIHNPVASSPSTWPPELATEVLERFGSNPVEVSDDAYNRTEADHRLLRDRLIERVAKKTDLACHYLDQGDWDMFLITYDESHAVGHQCWYLHDPHHPEHDPDLARTLGDPVKDIYVAIDKGIDRLLNRIGPETTVILFSGTGMGPNYTANHLLDDILARLDRTPPGLGTRAVNAMRSVWHKVPPRLRGRYRMMGRRLEQKLVTPDRSRRSCFAVLHNDISGAIRVNLVGREPNGRIHPGPEFDAFCERLTRDLLEIVNVETGQPIVREVVRTADLYKGEHSDDYADLFAVWSKSAPVRGVRSPKIGTIRRRFTANRTGDHTDHGLIIARGPGITPKRLPQPVSVLDFAPTVASILGVDLPDVEGAAIDSISGERRQGVRREGVVVN